MPGANQMGVRLDTAGPEIKRFRPLRGLRVLLGSALVLVGVLLFVPLLTVIILTGVLALSGSDVEATDVETVLILAGLTIGAIVVWTVGVKLIRGRTQTVLFLRKFGFADAKDFISHAAAQGLGRHWRLVTLDDLETSPVGSGRSVRWTLRFGRFLVLGLLVWLLWRLFIFSTDGVDSLIDDATDQAVSDAENAFEGFFVAVVMAFVVAIAAALVVAFFAVLVATVGAIGVFAFVSNRSLRRAERDKWTPVHDSQQLSDFIERTVKQRSRLFAPRVAVVRVVDELWKETVRDLAHIADAVLIDISDPTESLLWEVRMLGERPDIDLIVIGSGPRLESMAAGLDDIDRELFGLLANRTVLVYESDRRSFSQALRRTLEATLE